MSVAIKEPRELQAIYERRFAARVAYRRRLWGTLCEAFFQRYVRPTDTVLDLGCGYGEFINHIRAGRRLGMDLNPQSREHLDAGVEFLFQDCSLPWVLPDASLDVVFTSNFLEHLPDKLALKRTLLEAHRCLRRGGLFIALGPNIKLVNGAYWDFWDHFLCLTEASLAEGLENNGFQVLEKVQRFLPYTTVSGPDWPMPLVRAYLRCRPAWWLWGRQFLVVAARA